MNRCIISYASRGREDYPAGLPRLIEYAMRNGKHGFSQDRPFLILSPELGGQIHSKIRINPHFSPIPLHKDIPYGFKPHIFKVAFDYGYQQVLWMDSTIVTHKSLEPIWDIAAKEGACLFDNPGCPIRFWTSDDCMDAIGCPYGEPEQAMFNETMACAMAFDYSTPKGKKVFDEWYEASNDGVSFAGKGGSTRPEFRAHRHDQSVISWLAQKHQVPLQPYGMLCYNADRPKFPEHILANTGINEPIL